MSNSREKENQMITRQEIKKVGSKIENRHKFHGFVKEYERD